MLYCNLSGADVFRKLEKFLKKIGESQEIEASVYETSAASYRSDSLYVFFRSSFLELPSNWPAVGRPARTLKLYKQRFESIQVLRPKETKAGICISELVAEPKVVECYVISEKKQGVILSYSHKIVEKMLLESFDSDRTTKIEGALNNPFGIITALKTVGKL